MRASHWDIIVIRLTYVDTPKKILRVQVYMYEPVMDEEYHDDLEVVMKGVAKDDEKNIAEKEGIRGFLERWHAATADNVPLIINPVEWIKAPEQPDGSSCGVLGGGSGPQLSYWKHEAANLQCFEE